MGKSPRRLAWKDRHVEILEETLPSRFDDLTGLPDQYVFPDMTTLIPFILFLSQTEWTELYSAVLTGADLSYPEKSHTIEYLYLQTVLSPMAELCAALANCITTDTDVQGALLAFLGEHPTPGGPGNPEQPVTETIIEEELLPIGYGCTDDEMFGMAVFIADAINDNTTEVLQAIEVLTNPSEIAAELADNIPGLGALASAADVANWIQNTAKEEYDLAWSTSVRDDLACLIYCEMLDECTISFGMLNQIYLDNTIEIPPVVDTLLEWVVWLIGLPFTAPLQTVCSISMLGMIAMRFGGKFGEMTLGIQTLKTMVQLAEDETNSNWDILCTDCGWCINTNWDVDEDGWEVADDLGGAGFYQFEGWNYTDIVRLGQARRSISIEKSFTSANFTRIDLLFDFLLGSYPVTLDCLIIVTELSEVRTDVITIDTNDITDANGQHEIWVDAGGQEADYFKLWARSSADSTEPFVYDGDVFFHNVRFCGDGDKPGDL